MGRQMSCGKRNYWGVCGHHQCEFVSKTTHGYECVEVVNGFCEVGLNCVVECPHSFNSTKQDEARRAFESKYPANEVSE